MTTFSAYLQTWRPKLSNTKTVTAVFYLYNPDVKRELNVCVTPVRSHTSVQSNWTEHLRTILIWKHYAKKVVCSCFTVEATGRIGKRSKCCALRIASLLDCRTAAHQSGVILLTFASLSFFERRSALKGCLRPTPAENLPVLSATGARRGTTVPLPLLMQFF